MPAETYFKSLSGKLSDEGKKILIFLCLFLENECPGSSNFFFFFHSMDMQLALLLCGITIHRNKKLFALYLIVILQKQMAYPPDDSTQSTHGHGTSRSENRHKLLN